MFRTAPRTDTVEIERAFRYAIAKRDANRARIAAAIRELYAEDMAHEAEAAEEIDKLLEMRADR